MEAESIVCTDYARIFRKCQTFCTRVPEKPRFAVLSLSLGVGAYALRGGRLVFFQGEIDRDDPRLEAQVPRLTSPLHCVDGCATNTPRQHSGVRRLEPALGSAIFYSSRGKKITDTRRDTRLRVSEGAKRLSHNGVVAWTLVHALPKMRRRRGLKPTLQSPDAGFEIVSKSFPPLASGYDGSVQRFRWRYRHGSHWATRSRCDCSSRRLKPEAANRAMDAANDAAMPRTVAGAWTGRDTSVPSLAVSVKRLVGLLGGRHQFSPAPALSPARTLPLLLKGAKESAVIIISLLSVSIHNKDSRPLVLKYKVPA